MLQSAEKLILPDESWERIYQGVNFKGTRKEWADS